MYYVYRVSKDNTIKVCDTKDGVVDTLDMATLQGIVNKGYQIYGLCNTQQGIKIVAEFPVQPRILHYFMQMFDLCDKMLKSGKTSNECKAYLIEAEKVPKKPAYMFVDTYDATCQMPFFKEKLIEKMCIRFHP